MKVKLSQIQLDYLSENFLEKRSDVRQNSKITERGNSFWMDVDEATADEIRDWINLQLQAKGFDINYELTKEGEILDELNDIFYI